MWTVDDANAWADGWGFNCGPAAISAITGINPEALRPDLGDFERKRYTNPTLMREILKNLDLPYHCMTDAYGKKDLPWPGWGLVRVQWAGPWTRDGVPMRARYRHTHWVATEWRYAGDNPVGSRQVFDVNATCVGGWLPYKEWNEQLVPWILKELVPKADGRWWVTHSIEVVRNVRNETPEES